MSKNDIIRRNPLRMMGYKREDVLEKGDFGAIMARAGVGKTAFLVQLALDKILRGRTVLHISIDEPVEKVCLWYEEVFRNVASECNFGQLDPLWDDILPKRFIMTFKVDGFSVPKLIERVSDLTEQGIFFPQLIIVDGLPFESTDRKVFEEIKEFAGSIGAGIWFTVRTHRHEAPGPDGFPLALAPLEDMFEVVFELQPEGKDVFVNTVKGAPADGSNLPILLDPSTMMVRGEAADSGQREKTAS